MGANVRQLRGDHTSEELARCAQGWGLKWGTGRVSDLEAGRVAPTVPTIWALTLALEDLLGAEVPPAALFAGEGLVAIAGDEVELSMLRSVLSGDRPKRPMPAAGEDAGWWESVSGSWPPRLRDNVPGRWSRVKAAMTEADVRIGASLGLDRDRAAAEMAVLWGRPLSEQRDLLAEEGATAQRRGHLSRELKQQLRKAIDGDDQ